MATIAKLVVELGLEDNAFQRGIKNSREKLNDWGESLRSNGKKMSGFVTAPLTAGALAFVNWSSDLEQAMGKSDAVFGDASDSVIAWSKDSAKSFGFAQSDALAMASTYGSLFKVMDFSNDVAADYSTSLIGLSADMAAFNDVSNSRASEALMAGLTGEYMSLRSMGVFLNEAAVSQEALTIAQADGREEVTEADKVQARYNLIMKQTAQQQGQAARESKGWASRLAQVRAQMKNLGASIGSQLMPYALQLLDWGEKLMNWFSKLSPSTQRLIIMIAGLAAAIGPLMIAIGFMLPGLSALLAVIGFLVSPIGLVVVAIAALAAGAIYAYTHFERFREIVDTVAKAVKDFASGAIQKLIDAWNALKAAFDAGGWAAVWDTIVQAVQNALSAIGSAITSRVPGLSAAWNALSTAVSAAWDVISAVVGAVVDFATSETAVNTYKAAWSGLSEVVSTVKDVVTAVVGLVVDFATSETAVNTYKAAWSGLKTAVEAISSAIETVVGYVIDFTTSETAINAYKTTWTGLKTAVEAISSAVTTVVDMVVDFTTSETAINAYKATWNALKKGLDTVSQVIGAVVNYAIDFTTSETTINAYKTVWNGLKTAISAITGAISTVVGYVIDFTTAQTTIDTFKAAWDALRAAIDAISGAIDTVTSMVPDFSSITGPIDALISKVQAAIDLIKELGGMGSGGGTTVGAWDRTLDPNMPGSGAGIPMSGPSEPVLDPTTTRESTKETNRLSGAMANLGSIYSNVTQQAAAQGYFWAALSAQQKSIYEGVAQNNQILPQASSAWSGLGSALQPVTPQLVTVGAGFGALNTTAVTQTGQMQTGVVSAVGGMVGRALGSFLGLNTGATSQTKGMQTGVTGSASSMAGGLLGSVSGMTGGALSSFGSMQTGASGQARSMQGNVTGSTNTMQGGVLGALARMVSGVQSSMQTATTAISTHAAAWVMIINAYAGSMGAAGFNAGAAAGFGVANGLSAALGSVQAAASAIADIVAKTMALRLQIHSPSRVLERMVEAGVGPAIVNGIRSGIPSVVRAAGDMAMASIPGVERATEAMVNVPGMSSFDGIRQGQQQPSIIQKIFYSVTPEELQRLIRDAEDGGTFARQFGAEIAMRGGHA